MSSIIDKKCCKVCSYVGYEDLKNCIACHDSLCVKCQARVYQAIYCPECAYQLTGKKKPVKKENPIKNTYKELIANLKT